VHTQTASLANDLSSNAGQQSVDEFNRHNEPIFDIRLQMIGKEAPRFDFPHHIASFGLVTTSVSHAGDDTLALTLEAAEEHAKSEAAGKARREILAEAEEHMDFEAEEQTAKEAWLHSKREAQDQAEIRASKQIEMSDVQRMSGGSADIQAMAAAPIAPMPTRAAMLTTPSDGGSEGGL
jgi:hypothetical protein